MSTLPFDGVVFDLDDTLLRDDLTISDRTVATLRDLSARGVRIVPASGRAMMSMKPFVDQLACTPLFLACNGAEIWDSTTFRVLHQELFSRDLGREIAAFGKRHGCYSQTYTVDRFFYNEECKWSVQYAASSMLQGELVGDLEEYIQEPRCKILMMDEPEKISAMLAEARELFQGRVSVTCSKPWFLEFNPVNATKGIALQRAAEYLKMDVKRFLAFGDSLNDLSMLQAAGRGVLMANGRTDLRDLCDDVCGTNQEDGVALYLERVFETDEVPGKRQ